MRNGLSCRPIYQSINLISRYDYNHASIGPRDPVRLALDRDKDLGEIGWPGVVRVRPMRIELSTCLLARIGR